MRLRLGAIRPAVAARLRELRDSERGFTMLAAITIMVITSVLVTTAFVAADTDIGATQNDLYQKQASAAMQSGINDFVHHLNQDPTYWQDCPTSGIPTPVPVPGGANNQTYSYKWIAANGAPTCDATSPIPTMIDTPSGSFSMRFTGNAGTTANTTTRSAVVSFKRPSPLDYLWYTVFETLDPSVYRPPPPDPNDPNPKPPPNYTKCAAYYRDIPSLPKRPDYCSDIDWIDADVMNGPMYTEDEYQICGKPTFGRDKNDKIQSWSDNLTHKGGQDCPNSPNIKGTTQTGVSPPGLPTVNAALRVDALAASQKIFGGTTTITLNGDKVDIDAAEESTDGTTWAASPPQSIPLDQYPLIYVDNLAGCSASYTPFGTTYPSLPSSDPCGNVYVHGTYNGPLTIAASDDIVVDGDILTATSGNGTLIGPGILGLVANNFIRVRHDGKFNDDGDCTGSLDNDQNVTIDAALLALSHSFIVDNYNCGNPRGDLTVNGAIAQRFRGTVGTHGQDSHGNEVVSTGYAKKYTYDNRLKSQQPPYLFDLQNQSWRPFRETQCVVSGNTCD